jgi:uncharacterized protein (DUF433 family)
VDWKSCIAFDAAVTHGAACVRGTHIPVHVVLDSLANGVNEASILEQYPSLRLTDIRACLGYAAGLVRGSASADKL